MSDRRPFGPELGAMIFAGEGADPQSAAETAEQLVAAFMVAHQWRTPEGRSAYQMTCSMAQTAGGFVCTVVVVGPVDRTPW